MHDVILCSSTLFYHAGQIIQKRFHDDRKLLPKHAGGILYIILWLCRYLYGYLFLSLLLEINRLELAYHVQQTYFIMSKLQEKFTPLLPLITSILKQYGNRKELERVVFDQKLKLSVIQRIPNACLSDFRHSIQANFNKKQIFHAYPFNKHRSNYYSVIDKNWISLNAGLNHLTTQPTQFSSPYQPYFHFKKNYKEYLEDRPGINYRNQCQSVTIYSWSLKFVNISNTGYYCVVLHVLDSQRKSEKYVQNIGNISSIIYEPEIQQKMENFRLFDLRNNCKQAKDDKAPYSLFYYCRDSVNQSVIKKRPNNIFVVDNAQQFLKFDPQKDPKLICFGQIQGISCLRSPMKSSEINTQKLQALHTQNIDVFFNYIDKQVEKQKQKANQPMLWSSQSQSEQSYHSDQQVNVIQDVDEDQDSQESEDPLRNLYVKQFESLKLE